MNLIAPIIILAGGIFTIMSTVLIYHWQKYGVHRQTALLVMIVYLTVAILLFGAFIYTGHQITPLL